MGKVTGLTRGTPPLLEPDTVGTRMWPVHPHGSIESHPLEFSHEYLTNTTDSLRNFLRNIYHLTQHMLLLLHLSNTPLGEQGQPTQAPLTCCYLQP